MRRSVKITWKSCKDHCSGTRAEGIPRNMKCTIHTGVLGYPGDVKFARWEGGNGA